MTMAFGVFFAKWETVATVSSKRNKIALLLFNSNLDFIFKSPFKLINAKTLPKCQMEKK